MTTRSHTEATKGNDTAQPVKTFTKGQRVRSLLNQSYTYRVMSAGPIRARLIAEGIAYFTCYAPTAILRAL